MASGFLAGGRAVIAPSTAGVASPAMCRMLVSLVVVAALVSGFVVTDAASASRSVLAAGPDLVRLLRGMAVLKMLMAAGAVAGLWWRLGSAVTPRWMIGYALAAGLMAAGPGLIWDMTYLRTGAVLLHGGLLATLLLLWCDPATGSRLAAIVAARRAAIASAAARR